MTSQTQRSAHGALRVLQENVTVHPALHIEADTGQASLARIWCLKICVLASVCILLTSSALFGQTRPVKLMQVQSAENVMERIFFGRVKSRQTVNLAFQVGGQIVKFPIDEGQLIEKDTLIAELDLEPFELRLEQAQLELKQAQDDFERMSKLSRSVVSQVTVDDAETDAELKRVAVREAQRDLGLATLRSPFRGIVARRDVPNFTTIDTGTFVVRLHDMSDIRVEIEVPEIMLQRAERDPNVRMEVEFAANSQRFDLEFREIIAETTLIGQSFRLTLGMAPRDDLFVLPGASATVYATLLEEEAPLVIPTAALVFDHNDTASVMVFEPTSGDEGTVRRQKIEIAPTGVGSVQVTSGLNGGEEIVASGASFLSDGDSVVRFVEIAR